MKRTLPGLILAAAGMSCLIAAFLVMNGYTKSFRSFAPPARRHFEPDRKTAFSVAFFSDSGLRKDALESILGDQAAREEIVYSVFVGDLVPDLTEDAYLAAFHELASFAGKPLCAVPGNHDIAATGDATLFRRFFGDTSFWFGYADTLFIGLNSAPGSADSETLGFLERTLREQRPRFRRCVLFTHIPPLDLIGNLGAYTMSRERAGELLRLAEKGRVNLIVSGHNHHYALRTVRGITLLSLPTAGQDAHRPKNQDFGYVEVTFPADGGDPVCQVRFVTDEMATNAFSYFILKHKIPTFCVGLLLLFLSIGLLLPPFCRRTVPPPDPSDEVEIQH